MKRILSGIWTKKILSVVFLLSMTKITGLFSIDIKLDAPKLNTENPLASQIQPLIDNAFRDQEFNLQGELGPINLQKMTGAFADSSIFSSTGASLRAYQGYNILALTAGTVIGFQLPPKNIFSLFEEFTNINNEVNKLFADMQRERDLRLGLNPQILNAQLGINSGFLLKGLYLGIKGGYMNISINLDDMDEFHTSFQTWSAGGLINYQLIPRFRILGGIFLWRGLNLGAGFIYQNTSLMMDIPFSRLNLRDFDRNGNMTIPIQTPLGDIDGKISDAHLSLDFNVNTYTVPLEAITSIRLLGFLNIALGVGADLGFGNASLEGDGDARVTMEERYGLQVESPGSLSLSLSKESSTNLFNPKAMASFGFSAGPVIILDIPITYYFRNNGFNIGISLGIAL